eukprot:2114014-Rhodomonas_salina.1
MSGTQLAFATRRYPPTPMCGTDLAHGATLCGTELAYGATRCSRMVLRAVVLSERMVLCAVRRAGADLPQTHALRGQTK